MSNDRTRCQRCGEDHSNEFGITDWRVSGQLRADPSAYYVARIVLCDECSGELRAALEEWI